jgi:hypothetical protein
MMLSYTFLRERIINNNTLDHYDVDSEYKWYDHNLDLLFSDLSDSTENEIKLFKNKYPSIVKPLA